MKNVFNIKNIILFKTIIQNFILNRMREDDINNYNQHKNNKFLNNQFNRNYQFDIVCHFNNLYKIIN